MIKGCLITYNDGEDMNLVLLLKIPVFVLLKGA